MCIKGEFCIRVELKVQGVRLEHLQESVEEGGPPDTSRQDWPYRAIHPRHRGLQGPHGHLLSAVAPLCTRSCCRPDIVGPLLASRIFHSHCGSVHYFNCSCGLRIILMAWQSLHFGLVNQDNPHALAL